jgi:hypothetical protein
MGCCFSASFPPADAFLVDQPEAAVSLAPGFPRHVHIDPWLTMDEIPDSDLEVVDAESAETLATICMPEPGIFGEGATVLDPNEKPIAFLGTGETERRDALSPSSYNIYAPRPMFEGQEQVTPVYRDTKCLTFPNTYLWATVSCVPLSPVVKVKDARGIPIGEGYAYANLFAPHKFKFTRSDGTGAMWSGKTDDSRSDVRVAKGADALLSICVMFAQSLALVELKKDKRKRPFVKTSKHY